MKRTVAILIILILASCCALADVDLSGMTAAESVTQLRITLVFDDTSREGLYTGEINDAGLPDGFGVFEAVNSYGIQYYLIGQWENGQLTGHGWRACADGTVMIGAFDRGTFTEGNVFLPSVPQFYRAE